MRLQFCLRALKKGGGFFGKILYGSFLLEQYNLGTFGVLFWLATPKWIDVRARQRLTSKGLRASFTDYVSKPRILCKQVSYRCDQAM